MENENPLAVSLKRLCASLSSIGAAEESALVIDRLLRSHRVGDDLLAAVNDFQLFTVSSDEKTLALKLLVERSIQLSTARLSRFRPRSLWGVTPILTLSNCAKADRLLGVEAETLVYTTYHISSDFDINLKAPVDWIVENCPDKLPAYQWMVFCWALLSYDIFHFFNDRGLLANVGGYGSDRFGISLEEMQIFRRARKLLYTYSYGADHRMREATLAMGEYNLCMDCPEVGKFCVCDDEGGKKMLATIADYATAMLATGLSMKLIPNAKNLFYLVLDLNRPEFKKPRHAVALSPTLRIAHATNHGFFKGTQLLQHAVERLRSKGVPVELVMLSGVPNEQVLELMVSCDVVADQFISGAFGYTTIEAMALGVPVMCYLSPDLELPEPETSPIITCHPEHIEETILRLVESREALPQRGLQSREYVKRNYSVEAFSKRLTDLYQETAYWEIRLLSKRRGDVPFVTKWNFVPFRPGLVGLHWSQSKARYEPHKAHKPAVQFLLQSIKIGYEREVTLAGRRLNDSMGGYVARQLIDEFESLSIDPRQSRVLILGCIFKENCSDTRNTRVINIVKELKKSGISVDVFDPWVSADEVEADFGFRPISQPAEDAYHGVVIAVSRQEFRKMVGKTVRSFLKNKAVVYDLEDVLDPGQFTDGE